MCFKLQIGFQSLQNIGWRPWNIKMVCIKETQRQFALSEKITEKFSIWPWEYIRIPVDDIVVLAVTDYLKADMLYETNVCSCYAIISNSCLGISNWAQVYSCN